MSRRSSADASAARETSARPYCGSSMLYAISAWKRARESFARPRNCGRRYPSIVGIGIGGDEARGPADQFRELYKEAGAAGLRLTAHAGESVGPESIWSAINIGAERIGHALSAQHDPELIEVLARKQIPLEINITSNIKRVVANASTNIR